MFSPLQIILMSAAINCREFAEYFGRTVKGKINPAYVFEVEGAPYAIEEFYLDDIGKLVPFQVRRQRTFASILNGLWGSWNNLFECCFPQIQDPYYDTPHISPEMYNLAISLIQMFDEMEGKESRWDQNFHTDMLGKKYIHHF